MGGGQPTPCTPAMRVAIQRAGVKLRRTMNNAAGERSEPAASEAGADGFNATLGSGGTGGQGRSGRCEATIEVTDRLYAEVHFQACLNMSNQSARQLQYAIAAAASAFTAIQCRFIALSATTGSWSVLIPNAKPGPRSPPRAAHPAPHEALASTRARIPGTRRCAGPSRAGIASRGTVPLPGRDARWRSTGSWR